MHRFATMGEVHKTSCSLPLVDLTNDNVSENNAPETIDLTESDFIGTGHSPEIVDLTYDHNEHFTSNIPLIDLTCDKGQFLNCRVPVIDLRNDDVNDITYQTHCIDLTYNDASRSDRTIRNLNLGQIDEDSNRSIKLIDLTADDVPDFTNLPLIDLTCDNDQFLNCTTNDIDMTSDNIHDITHLLQRFDLTDNKQKIITECIPTINLTNHNYQSIEGIIPANDLVNARDCININIPVIDLIQNDDRVIRKTVDNVEKSDLTCNNAPIYFQKGIENLRITAANFNYKASENDFLECNETSNVHVGTFRSKQNFHNTEISANSPLKYKLEDRQEAIITKQSQRNNTEKHCSSTEKFQKISQNRTPDFPKPAHHPVPLRHSFGKSTVKTSQNVPIECADESEDQSRFLTVSSIFHRKKSKSSTLISKQNIQKSKKLSTAKENAFSFEYFNGFFGKFWIIFLFTCIILLVLNVGF